MASLVPHPALRPFVSLLWASDDSDSPASSAPSREHALPTGAMHLVFRLGPTPLRLYRSHDDTIGYTVGHALIGGARSTHYIRDTSVPSPSIGAMLRPGAAEILFKATAEELAEQHTSLECVWGHEGQLVHEQLAEAPTAQVQLALFERILLERLPTVRGLHPAVAAALADFAEFVDVQTAVKHSGYSHRRFIAQFRRAVGLTPKTYVRIKRFQRALGLAVGGDNPDWSSIAADVGLTDQSHLIREFKSFAGVTPEQYRAARPVSRNHLPR